MYTSVKSLVEAVRLVAVQQWGLALPLTKARNAISLVLYGKHYSAAMAAEKAGSPPELRVTPENKRMAVDAYRVREHVLVEAVHTVFEREAEADEPLSDADVLEALRFVISGVEHAVAQGKAAWASFLDTDDLLDQFGDEQFEKLEDVMPDFVGILDEAIDTDGRSLVADIDGLVRRLDPVCNDLSWLEALRSRIADLSLVPPRPRRPNRWALMLMFAPDLSSFTPGTLPHVDYDLVDFARLADALADALHVPPEALRIANDVVDQLTIHKREHLGVDALRFEDVLEQVWDAAEQQESRVLDVRTALAPIHFSPYRRNAPPPMGILFVLETTEYFEGTHHILNARGSLGITAGTLAELFSAPGTEFSHEGRLPPALKGVLQQMFGAPCYPEAYLGRPFNKNRPARYAHLN